MSFVDHQTCDLNMKGFQKHEAAACSHHMRCISKFQQSESS
ncbi:hypothetical protein I3842_04G183400 [Carya illinoinensis]|uniref:Uncharacterized protein n=1 Tax=Carya illinoinensis TaxID=32201 RepID=A0A922FEE1_CARIL|nr:hypothetical protein I3842_04G183400 [Carya illinoinensis]